MSKIIAIGGGEIGRPGFPVETMNIDEQIIKLSGKKNPRLLFIPTASHDAESYVDAVREHFGGRLGCTVKTLMLYSNPLIMEIKNAIDAADVIYVGGGNTLKMMTKWRKMGVDKLLLGAAERGAVLSGLSAGAICWFKGGLSDSRSFTASGKNWDYITVKGLKLYNIILCPHFSSEPKRIEGLKHSLKGTKNIAVALDNSVALEIDGEQYRIIGANSERSAYKTFWKNGKYYIEKLTSMDYQPLSSLTKI
ncbi:MAG: peptidase [Candidatus Saccharibacteria bacterium]|nr:peptidase [Candidatus Saccharibacteria bacterium]